MLGINGLVSSGFGRGIALSVLANFWSYEQGLPQETNINRFGVVAARPMTRRAALMQALKMFKAR